MGILSLHRLKDVDDQRIFNHYQGNAGINREGTAAPVGH
jgi:hypothetical protein